MPANGLCPSTTCHVVCHIVLLWRLYHIPMSSTPSVTAISLRMYKIIRFWESWQIPMALGVEERC